MEEIICDICKKPTDAVDYFWAGEPAHRNCIIDTADTVCSKGCECYTLFDDEQICEMCGAEMRELTKEDKEKLIAINQTHKTQFIKFLQTFRNLNFSEQEILTILKKNGILKLATEETAQKIYADLSNCWSKQTRNYHKHKCNGQDGTDIGFTKKDFEGTFKKYGATGDLTQ